MRNVLTTLAFAAAATLVGTATIATPAFAQSGDVCATQPAQIRAIAATSADANAVRRANGHVATAEKLCEAGNEREAGKKLKVAMKLLNVDVAALPTTVAAQ